MYWWIIPAQLCQGYQLKEISIKKGRHWWATTFDLGLHYLSSMVYKFTVSIGSNIFSDLTFFKSTDWIIILLPPPDFSSFDILKIDKKKQVQNKKTYFNPFPPFKSHDLISRLLMNFESLYCKQNGPRSESLIRVRTACFHCNLGYQNLQEGILEQM